VHIRGHRREPGERQGRAGVRRRATPEVTLEDGRAALALAIDIQQQMAEHHKRAHLDEIAQAMHRAIAGTADGFAD